jgi:ribose transport system substrate-binding protein
MRKFKGAPGIRLPLRAILGAIMILGGFGTFGGLVSASSASASPAKHLNITGVVAQSTDPYFISMRCGAQAAANALGNVKLTWQGPTSASVAQEITTLESVAVTKPDGVILGPFDPTAFLRPVTQLMNAGRPVYLVDSFLSKNVSLGETNTDVTLSAGVLANSIGKMMGGKGQLGIIAFGAGDPYEGPRYLNMVKVLNKKFPNIKVLPVQYASSDENKAAQITSGLLVAYPHLSAIYATDGPAGEGAAAALRSAGKSRTVKVVAFDAEPLQVQGLKNGTFQALYAQAPYIEGYTAMTQLVKYLRGPNAGKGAVHPQKPFYIPSPQKFLTKSNITTASGKKYLYTTGC